MIESTKELAGALLFAGAALLSTGAAAGDAGLYRPAQGLSHVFGSKHAVGYFLQRNGACAVNLFLAENTGEDAGPSASRLQLTVMPGDNVKLSSAEGQTIEMKCGDGAATLEVKAGSVSTRYVSR